MHTIYRNILLLFGLVLAGCACDPEGKQECAWTLEPEPKYENSVQKGFIPVCARNRITKKQDCRYQAKMEFAKSALERKFRYTDVKVLSPALPRTIKSIKFCDGQSPTFLE